MCVKRCQKNCQLFWTHVIVGILSKKVKTSARRQTSIFQEQTKIEKIDRGQKSEGKRVKESEREREIQGQMCVSERKRD